MQSLRVGMGGGTVTAPEYDDEGNPLIDEGPESEPDPTPSSSSLEALAEALKELQEVRPIFAWRPLIPKEVEVEPGSATPGAYPMCPACGWPITDCVSHDEEELEIIRLHEAGVHDECMEEGCEVAEAREIEKMEKRFEV